MTKIIVKNNEWDDARNKLQTSLDTQRSDFSAKMKAAFAPQAAKTAAPAVPAAAPVSAPRSASSATASAIAAYRGLPRSRRA